MVNIILPVDFSDATEKLVDGALRFARETNGKICLIHVAPSDIGFAIGDMGFQYFPEVEENEIKHELMELNKLEQRIIAQGIDCEHLLKQGVAGDVILEYAKENSLTSYIKNNNPGAKTLRDFYRSMKNVSIIYFPYYKYGDHNTGDDLLLVNGILYPYRRPA